jgi:hypothetical protein
MPNTNPERFFELVTWFNNFSNQLYTLYTKISSYFAKELNLKEIRRYSNSSQVMPYISEVFHMGFKGKEEFSIHVMTILNKDKLTHIAYDHIPSIFVVKLDGGNGYFSNELWPLFSEENSTLEKDAEGFIKGLIKVGGEDWIFNASQVNIELFNSESVDSVISKEILPKMRKMLE